MQSPAPENGYVYDERTHSIRFQGAAKKKAFLAKIEITSPGASPRAEHRLGEPITSAMYEPGG